MTFSLIISFELAYLIGAIPFSILIGKLFYGKDVRNEGSGNPGATNTFRVLGKRAGILVLILDVAKGMAATLFAGLLFWQLRYYRALLYHLPAGAWVGGNYWPCVSDLSLV